MRSRNPLRVLVAPRTRIEDIVAGKVELSSTCLGEQMPNLLIYQVYLFRQSHIPIRSAAVVLWHNRHALSHLPVSFSPPVTLGPRPCGAFRRSIEPIVSVSLFAVEPLSNHVLTSSPVSTGSAIEAQKAECIEASQS